MAKVTRKNFLELFLDGVPVVASTRSSNRHTTIQEATEHAEEYAQEVGTPGEYEVRVDGGLYYVIKVKNIVLDANILPSPPAAQATFKVNTLSPLTGPENYVINARVDRTVKFDQTISVDWAVVNATVLPAYQSGTLTFVPSQTLQNFAIYTGNIDTTEIGSFILSNPQYVSGPVSQPILGTPSTVPFTVTNVPVIAGTFLWNGGNVEDGSFDEWHFNSTTAQVQFSTVSSYGRPPNYGATGTGAGAATQTQAGDGSLLNIVDVTGSGGYPLGPTRGGNKAIRFVIKNSVNGTEPADCDIATDCRWRRSMLVHTQFTVDVTTVLPKVAILPNNGPVRWISYSIYLDNVFPLVRDNEGVSDFCDLAGFKAGYTVGAGPYEAPVNGWFGIFVGDNGWSIRDTWFGRSMSGGVNPPLVSNVDYRYQSSYNGAGAHFGSDEWNDGYNHFTPTGQAMLANVVRGAWTDFIIKFKTDTVNESLGTNQGFLDLYMRNQGGSWVLVLQIRPINVSNGLTYFKGIGCDGAYYTNFGIGIYTNKGRTWNAPNNAIAYFSNVKIGDENTTFSQMTHDGSTYP